MSIDLRVAGHGPAAIFLHGCPSNPDLLGGVAGRVAGFCTVVQVALPGYGDSAPLRGPWKLADLHESIEHALITRGFREVALVGFSGGAYHALALASRGILSVTGIVSLAGLMSLTAEERTAFHETAAAIRGGADIRAIAGPRFLSAGFRSRQPERIVEVERWLDATAPSNFAAELVAFAEGEDLTERVRELVMPVLARVGDEDVATPPGKSEAIVSAARHGRLQVVPGVGHALTIEDPESTAEAVENALRAQSPESRS